MARHDLVFRFRCGREPAFLPCARALKIWINQQSGSVVRVTPSEKVEKANLRTSHARITCASPPLPHNSQPGLNHENQSRTARSSHSSGHTEILFLHTNGIPEIRRNGNDCKMELSRNKKSSTDNRSSTDNNRNSSDNKNRRDNKPDTYNSDRHNSSAEQTLVRKWVEPTNRY
jgi:hypothetical protein